MSLRSRKSRIHFVGIGGIGMSGIAELLLTLGHSVSGSDLSEGETVQRLRSLGAVIHIGHSGAFAEEVKPDVVVYSSAVKWNNPEIVFAREKAIPVIKRAEMLGELMRLKRGIAIAGSHGKTTTTGLVSLLLGAAGLKPTVVIGGRFDAIGSNAAWGEGDWLVAETDESDGSFLRLTPELAVVTNIDPEHLDHYGSFEGVKQGFEEFLDRLPFYGRAVLCSDCPNLREVASRLNKARIWYGLEAEHEPDFLVRVIEEGAQPRFEISEKATGYKKAWLRAKLSVPGRHNVANAAAAALVARELEVPVKVIENTLAQFHGVSRRFQKRGLWRGHPVIEDYAHHPTEIKATLAAALSAYAPLKPVVLFQPHRFSRTRDLWKEFGACFEGASALLTLPIYAASEAREEWVRAYDGPAFAAHVSAPAGALACEGRDEMMDALAKLEASGRLGAGAPILVLGAGDIFKIIPPLLARA